VFKALHASTLIEKQKREELREISIVQEKRDGSIKGRMCANNRSHCSIYTKEETVLLTVSTDALMLTLMIAAI